MPVLTVSRKVCALHSAKQSVPQHGLTPNQKILTVYSTPQYLEKIKDALRHSGHKLPTPSHLKVSTIKVSGRIVAAPKLVGEKVVAAPVVAEEAAAALSPQRKQSRAAAQSTQRAARMPAPAAKGGKDAAPAKGAAPAKADDKKGAPAKGGKK